MYKKAMKKVLMLLCFMMLITSVAIPASAKAKVGLNKTKITLVQGKSTKLKMKGTKKKVKWQSSNKKIATVTSKGKVTAKKAGNCKFMPKQAKRSIPAKSAL